MKQLSLTVFATDSKGAFIAHALLVNDLKSNELTCEIHIGKMITRFNPNPDYFLEDVLWQLADYCEIPMFEIECDMHYPPPISIEEELGEDECMDIRLRIEDYLKESGLTYFVVSSPSIDILMKIHNMKIKGVNIETTSAFSLN